MIWIIGSSVQKGVSMKRRETPGQLLDWAFRMVDLDGWRLGQALWNCCPQEFRDTEPSDPWNLDSRIPSFLTEYKEWYEQN